VQGIPDSGIIAGINIPVFENRNSRNIIPDSGSGIPYQVSKGCVLAIWQPCAKSCNVSPSVGNAISIAFIMVNTKIDSERHSHIYNSPIK
jgi:hypothetical protein